MSSGKFIVRIPPSLHAQLKSVAKHRGSSLNDVCIDRLAVPGALEAMPEDLAEAARALLEIAGKQLTALAVFGSFARGDQTSRSDIDVLVVLNPGTPINREIYRRWEAVAASATNVEPHFVTLPALTDRVSGLWAEVSMDGVIVCDSQFALQRYLGHVRKLIAAGRLVSKRIHGQNYWVHDGVA